MARKVSYHQQLADFCNSTFNGCLTFMASDLSNRRSDIRGTYDETLFIALNIVLVLSLFCVNKREVQCICYVTVILGCLRINRVLQHGIEKNTVRHGTKLKELSKFSPYLQYTVT